jgi:hypothetical protein
MAAPVLTYTREPAAFGDNGAWAPYLIAQTRAGGLGALSLELYNNGGALNMREGFAGIDDGVTRGVIECTTDGDIDTAGMTANCWHQVELSIVGIAATLTIAAIAGATDESLIPTTVKAAYDASKQGYYMTASKRLVGVVFLRTALALGRVVNCEHVKRGFRGVTEIVNYESGAESLIYITETLYRFDIDLDALPATEYEFPFYCPNNTLLSRLIDSSAQVTSDDGSESSPFSRANNADCAPEVALNRFTITSNHLHFVRPYRVVGGEYDAATFDNAQIVVWIKYET